MVTSSCHSPIFTFRTARASGRKTLRSVRASHQGWAIWSFLKVVHTQSPPFSQLFVCVPRSIWLKHWFPFRISCDSLCISCRQFSGWWFILWPQFSDGSKWRAVDFQFAQVFSSFEDGSHAFQTPVFYQKLEVSGHNSPVFPLSFWLPGLPPFLNS